MARVRDYSVVVADLSNPMVFWRRRQLEYAIIFFQVLENSRGRFALLSLESFKGRRTRVFVPEGKKGSGWRLLAGKVSGLLPSSTKLLSSATLGTQLAKGLGGEVRTVTSSMASEANLVGKSMPGKEIGL